MELQPHQQRVVEEKAQNDDRLIKLTQFICANPLFGKVDDAEKARLRRQRSIMAELSDVLGERIEAF